MKKALALISFLIFAGVFIYSCGDKNDDDPCEGITCLNGGTCVEGVCQCPEKYTGSRCQKQAVPSAIKVSKIIVKRWPYTNGGQDWDANSGADLILSMMMEGIAEIYASPYPILDVYPGQAYTFNLSPKMNITEPEKSYTLRLLDQDDDENQLMGEIVAKVYEDGNGFPEKLLLDDGGNVAFELYMTYDFF